MSTGDESGGREPMHFIHKYISHELEPGSITESSDMVQTRKTRNDVVHGLHSSDFLDYLNESPSKIDKVIDVTSNWNQLSNHSMRLDGHGEQNSHL